MPTPATVEVKPERIRQARLEAGYSTREMARHLGFSDLTIYKWESGRTNPKISSLRGFAKATRRPVPWFFADGWLERALENGPQVKR